MEPSAQYEWRSIENLPAELLLMVIAYLGLREKVALLEISLLPLSLIANNGLDASYSDTKGKGTSLLYAATEEGFAIAAKALLNAGANPSIRHPSQSGNETTPLLNASQLGHTSIIRLLIAHGASVHDHDGVGRTPLHLAVRNNHEPAVNILLEHGADPNSQPGPPGYGVASPLHTAAELGFTSIVALLLQYGGDKDLVCVPASGHTPLFGAANNGHVDVVKLLLAAGANPNGQIIVHDPHGRRLTGVPVHLLQWVAGARFFGPANTRMWKFTEVEMDTDTDTDRAGGIRNGALPIKEEQWWPGDKERFAEVLRSLVEAGADADAVRERSGSTALHFAAAVGNERAVGVLVEAGVDLNAKLNSGVDALWIARGCGYEGIVRVLEEAMRRRSSQPASEGSGAVEKR